MVNVTLADAKRVWSESRIRPPGPPSRELVTPPKVLHYFANSTANGVYSVGQLK